MAETTDHAEYQGRWNNTDGHPNHFLIEGGKAYVCDVATGQVIREAGNNPEIHQRLFRMLRWQIDCKEIMPCDEHGKPLPAAKPAEDDTARLIEEGEAAKVMLGGVLQALKWAGFNEVDVRDPSVHIDALARRVAELERELMEIGQFASAHHADQPSHVWLHALTVDIPRQVEIAIFGMPADGPAPASAKEGGDAGEEFQIFINTQSRKVQGPSISFEQVLALAGVNSTDMNSGAYEVEWLHGSRSGRLTSGASVALESGMRFDAGRCGLA